MYCASLKREKEEKELFNHLSANKNELSCDLDKNLFTQLEILQDSFKDSPIKIHFLMGVNFSFLFSPFVLSTEYFIIIQIYIDTHPLTHSLILR